MVAAVGDRRAGRDDPRPGRRGPGDLRPLRWGRLLGRGAARPPRDRRAADLRLRRPRPDAAERGRAGGRRRSSSSASRSSTSTPRSASSPSLAGIDEPERKRKIIGEEFIRVFEEEAAKLEDAAYLVQGTLYSDVIESGGSDARRHDQVPPQRRRPARGPRVRAGRAAADAVQGRGARGRRRAGAARADGLAPALPGARPRRSASSAAR